jgi:hypothetical protein
MSQLFFATNVRLTVKNMAGQITAGVANIPKLGKRADASTGEPPGERLSSKKCP